ncbi:MAG TPA: hypothetical protein VF605_03225 [Allosphingosinicella sp.]|jgi:hypothetical protein
MPDVTGLFDSFLEAAVSMAVLFVIVAWVSSKIVELGQLTFNVHGKMLRDELERCFGEDGRGDPRKGRFTRYFYWHPMIVPLTQPSALVSAWRRISGWFPRRGEETPADSEARFPPGRLPGHIAPESFAAVVMNPFPWPTTEDPLRRLLKANLADASAVADDDLDAAIGKLIRWRQGLTAGQTWRALLGQLGLDLPLNEEFLDSRVDIHSGPGGGDPAERYVEMCRANELVPHPLETRIITLLRDADNDLDEFRGGLRRWYAEAMARVTGRFKRTALVYVFFVALVICTLFNLNAINLFSALMASPELRRAGVAAAQVVGTRPGGIEALSQKIDFAQATCVTTAPPLQPDCARRLLRALWRDSTKLNEVDSLFSDEILALSPAPTPSPAPSPSPPASNSATPSTAPKAGAVTATVELSEAALAQVREIRTACVEHPDLCTPVFKAKLESCLKADSRLPARECRDAWDAIWSSSGFFWHPEAAHRLALSLLGTLPKEEAADLPGLLKRLQAQAQGETEAVARFIRDIPNVGPVWNDKKVWLYGEDGKPTGANIPGILWIMFGILLSALLAALGAPFWYDVLGKLSRRGTSGARGEKT